MNSTKKKNSFRKYIEKESKIRATHHVYKKISLKERSYSKYRFFENTGAFELFSILKAQSLFDNASWHYGEDKARHVRQLLIETCNLGNRKAFAKAPNQQDLDQLAIQFPHFSEAIDQLTAAAALSARSRAGAFTMTPLLLTGPPGVGKTAFCQVLAKVIDVSFRRLDAGTMSTSAEISGLSFTWSTGQSGGIYSLMTKSKFANPIVMFDELDKIEGNHSAPIEPALLSLLEPESNKSFTDAGMLLPLDCRHLLIIATANDTQAISSPLLSRFQVIDISAPTPEQNKTVIQNIYRGFIQSEPWGNSFQTNLDDSVIERLALLSPRKVNQVLRQAFGRAAVRGTNKLQLADIKTCEKKLKKTIGFI